MENGEDETEEGGLDDNKNKIDQSTPTPTDSADEADTSQCYEVSENHVQIPVSTNKPTTPEEKVAAILRGESHLINELRTMLLHESKCKHHFSVIRKSQSTKKTCYHFFAVIDFFCVRKL